MIANFEGYLYDVYRSRNECLCFGYGYECMQLFEFGDKYRGKYDTSIEVVKSYYGSVSGYMDELLWSALWLYKATDSEQHYMDYFVNNSYAFGGIGWSISEFSWDVKYAGIQILASQVKPTKSIIILFHMIL